jgi:hypothetical protein
MLKYLARLFRSDAEPKPDQVSSAPLASNKVADAAEEESAPVQREALTRFTRLATAHLDEAERHRLMQVMLASFDRYGNSSEAFEEVALGKEGQVAGQWFVIQCDWKASEEVEWQVSAVATGFGIPEPWSWGVGDEKARTVPGGLCEVAKWAAPLGFEMLHIDVGSDTYFAILIKRDDAECACQAAASAGLKVLRTPEFELSHA